MAIAELDLAPLVERGSFERENKRLDLQFAWGDFVSGVEKTLGSKLPLVGILCQPMVQGENYRIKLCPVFARREESLVFPRRNWSEPLFLDSTRASFRGTDYPVLKEKGLALVLRAVEFGFWSSPWMENLVFVPGGLGRSAVIEPYLSEYSRQEKEAKLAVNAGFFLASFLADYFCGRGVRLSVDGLEERYWQLQSFAKAIKVSVY